MKEIHLEMNRMSKIVLFMAAIFGHLLMHSPGVSCEGKSIETCPSSCTCSQKTVDCSRKDLKTFPTSLPSSTLILNLKGNKITKIDKNDVAHLTNLKTLYLDENLLTQFPDIGGLTSLQILTISRNSIIVIPHGTLSRLSSLTWLDLSHNQIVSLPNRRPNGTFPVKTKLEYLDLSYNNITSMIDLVEVSMPSLTHLKLSYNKLPNLSCLSCQTLFGQAKNFKSVKILALDHNEIATGVNFFFSHFPSVEKLDLSANRFQTISVGVLHGTSKLKELYLNGNQLDFLTVRMFYMRDQLRILDMSNNRLQGIDQTAFIRAKNIVKLNLAGNLLKNLGPGCFAPLTKLKSLYLERNQISKISGSAFRGLSSLLVLNLSRNAISLGQSELDTAFVPLLSLKTLDLTHNDIMLVPRNAFRGLHQLQSMNLSSNHIITVQTGAFADLTTISHMYLQAPKLICDCSARWLRNWVKEHSFQKTVTGKCKTPLWLAGKSLFDIDTRDFVCASKVNNSIKPEIIVHPKTQEAQRKSNVTLRCVATVLFPETQIFGLTEEDRRVRSSMNMEWYFYGSDGREHLIRDKIVKTSPQQHIGRRVYRRMTELTLRRVDYIDNGRYRCHVRNYYGDEWSQKANLSVVVFPYFIKKPVDTRVRSGVSVQISCSAEGSPIPIVKVGRKKGERFPAVDEKRFWFKSGRRGYEFGISNVKIEDSGEYICSAASRVGVINSSMILTVIEKPQFIRSMKSKKVIISSTAVFECMFTGNPKPKVEWFKNNTKIQKGKNGRHTVSDQLLIILEVRMEDAGTYSCRVSNALGMNQQFARLAVVTDASQIEITPPKEGDMPLKLFIGIIVITVISVTIVTSVIWVVLIWVCKGRRSRMIAKQSSMRTETTEALRSSLLNTDNLPENTDHYTVPPLVASDGSGLVFSCGHLYPDNQRNFTDKDVLAHIRGENLTPENIPLMNSKDVVPDHTAESEFGTVPTVVCGTSSIELTQPETVMKGNTQDIASIHRLNRRIQNSEPLIAGSNDFLLEQRKAMSPRKETIYCSCPSDISEGTVPKNIDAPQKRTGGNWRHSHKKKVPRRPSHALHQHNEEFMEKYNNASSSGVESGESSSSSDTVSVSNYEVTRAKSSSVVGPV